MKKVVVTGMGVLSPIGSGLDKYWTALCREECGIDRISLFDPSRFRCQIAAEVRDISLADELGSRTLQRTARFTQFAMIAAREAWKQTGLDITKIDPFRTAIFLGIGIGGLDVDSESQKKLVLKGPEHFSALTIPRMISNEAAGNIAMDLGIRGLGHTIATACASGTDAIGHAMDLIRLGRADIIVTGGTEAAITEFGLAGFCALKALATSYNNNPKKASRPFDRKREGFIMGEGSGILVLESEEHAQARGANILAEIAGYGASIDGYHLTAPDPEGAGCAHAIQNALTDANMEPDQIDYINAHGTSTPTNDPVETAAIKKAFGTAVNHLKISSIKGMIGHCLGAAGALEAIASIMTIRNNFIPATINLEEPDPLCDLDYVPNQGIEWKVNTAMSTSLGFGGHNGVLIFRRYDNGKQR